jgi:hypothetical protein
MQEERRWTVDETKAWRPLDGRVEDTLNPGLYECKTTHTMFGTDRSLAPMTLATDHIMDLPGSIAAYVSKSVNKFWEAKDKYKRMGLAHKRGIMLHGLQGGGKTAVCLSTGLKSATKGAIALFTGATGDVSTTVQMLQVVRQRHPEAPILSIIEDIDRHDRPTQVDLLLSMLEGDKSIAGVFHIATTNYIQNVDARLVDRPGRYDELPLVGPPAEETRRAYLNAILPVGTPDAKLNELVKVSDGLSFAQTKELAISAYVYDRDPATVAKRLLMVTQTVKTNDKTGLYGDTSHWSDADYDIAEKQGRTPASSIIEE